MSPTAIINTLNQLHPSHLATVELCCKTLQPYFLVPELDFTRPEVRAVVESYIATEKHKHVQ